MFTDIETTLQTIKDFALKYAGIIVYCVVILLLGKIICKCLIKLVKAAMTKANVSEKIVKFTTSIMRIVFYIIIVLVILDAFDIPTTSLVALFSAVGLALSLAIKDTLANFAEGLIMMFTKPFQVGDFIETEGVSGTVQGVELVYTRLLTPDNKAVLIPNGEISAAKIINYSAEPTRRLDLIFSIGYSDEIEKAKAVIEKIIATHPLSLKEPEPFIRVVEHGASSIDIAVRVWVNSENYWDLSFDMKESVKTEFDKNNINIPYPHMDINILEKSG